MGLLDGKLDFNEVKIFLGKESYILKLTFHGIREMENRACAGIAGLVARFASSTVGLNDVVSIIYGGILGKAGAGKDPEISFEKIGELVLEHGMKDLLEPCNNVLIYAYTGIMPDDFKEDQAKKKVQ